MNFCFKWNLEWNLNLRPTGSIADFSAWLNHLLSLTESEYGKFKMLPGRHRPEMSKNHNGRQYKKL
jgi:hypothetical protein